MNRFLLYVMTVVFIQCAGRPDSSPLNDEPQEGSSADGKGSATKKSGALPPEEYLAWVNSRNNGLATAVSEGGVTYSFRYTPVDLIALQRIDDTLSLRQRFQSERSAIAGYQYYTLSLASDTGEDIVKYRSVSKKDEQQRADYYSYAMQQDLRLVDGGDTLRCLMFHYEKTFGVLPYTNFLLGFELTEEAKEASEKGRPSVHEDKTLVFRDRVLGLRQIDLTLRGEKLNAIPVLSIR